MPYQKTKEGRLVNEITLGDGYPLSNDKQPLKVGGEASIINVSSPTPDGSVDGEVEIKGNLKAKDTAIEGNFSATSIENVPQFNFHSRNNISARLDVQASANQTSSIRIKNNQGYFDIKRLFSSTSLQFTDGTNTPLTLDGANVGIGTTSPLTPLHIESSVNALSDTDDPENCHLLLRNPANDTDEGVGLGFLISAGTGDIGASVVYKRTGTAAKGELRFNVKTNTDSEGVITQAMTIADDAKVGIGLTAPTTTLDVEGTVSYKHTAFTTAGPTDNVDVSGTTVLECDTSGGHLTIGGFSGGVQGQILYVLKTTTDLNRVILENNEGGGSQDIFLSSGADLSISLPSGIALYCNGSDWFALDK